MMLKAPISGLVKTRLGREIGFERAVVVYRALVERQLSNIPPGFPVSVAFAPVTAGDMMRAWLGDGSSYFPQVDGDLGERLRAAADSCLSGGSAVLFVGGDCPGLDRERIVEAAEALRDADVVVVPALDGGYCLIGISSMRSALVFDQIAWSTPEVLEQTRRRSEEGGLKLKELEPALEDVDDLDSWNRALASASIQNPGQAEAT